ncbi:Protein kinase C-binding protein NELL1 [Fukomys damarensis]|uniref:Protein kinase C-binding protein NELL1 n=1 Tax=Fukomys damarensis TaxID=885580 RepID=A0A091EM13_FUKDA|nr:Protein kinase C-binding protein NELL1 [Fukomys damarensis]
MQWSLQVVQESGRQPEECSVKRTEHFKTEEVAGRHLEGRRLLATGFGKMREADLLSVPSKLMSENHGLDDCKLVKVTNTEREIHAAPHVSEKFIQLFRNKSEFTFLATVQQKPSTSGVVLSIRELEHSYFELESSGLRDEIRYHYMHRGRPRTEALPYRMADGQWHKVALTVSASHLLLHVDCNRIYERVIDPPETNLPPGSNLWLGQRNQKHGLFKGIIQDGKIIFMPNGYITQCPNLNRTCPTCSDFLSLVQGIMDLQELLAKMTAKLNYAETRLSQLENCHCEKTCQVSGLLYRDQDSWVDGDHCRNCTCKSGVVECRRMSCPPLRCSPDSLPVHIAGQCCKVCRPKCIYGGKVLAEGQRILTKSCRECRGGVLVKITETCPPLNCSEKDHILPENQCCRVCRGHNFCVDAPKCGENSECKNWNTKATCECKNGYISVQGDSAYCEGKEGASFAAHSGETASETCPWELGLKTESHRLALFLQDPTTILSVTQGTLFSGFIPATCAEETGPLNLVMNTGAPGTPYSMVCANHQHVSPFKFEEIVCPSAVMLDSPQTAF